MSWATQEWQQRRCEIFDHWAITIYGTSFQKFNLITHFVTPLDKSILSPYNPLSLARRVWALSFSLAATKEITIVLFSSRYWNVLLPWVCVPRYNLRTNWVYQSGFPHSEISGSKVAWHLPETYRRHATSFIAFFSLGIHHILLNFLLGNLKNIFIFFSPKKNQINWLF